jgi:hypothetical protein
MGPDLQAVRLAAIVSIAPRSTVPAVRESYGMKFDRRGKDAGQSADDAIERARARASHVGFPIPEDAEPMVTESDDWLDVHFEWESDS